MKRITFSFSARCARPWQPRAPRKPHPRIELTAIRDEKPPAGSPGDRIGIGERTLVLWISDGMRTAPGVQHVPQVAFPANFHPFFRDSAEVGGESVPSCTRKET